MDRKTCPNTLEFSTKEIDLSVLNPQCTKLNNGIEIFSFHAPDAELLKIDFVFDAGSRYQSTPLIAASVNALLTEGTKSRKMIEIAEFLDFRGAHIEKTAGKDTAGFTVYMLKKYVKDILPLLHEIVYTPVFPEKEMDIYLRKRKQQFLTDNQKVSFLARTHFSKLIFGAENPYGKMAVLSDFDSLDRQELLSFHEKFYTQTPFKILVAGNITEDIHALISEYFESSVFSNREKTAFPLFSNTEKQAYIELPNAVQSALRMGKTINPVKAEDLPYLSVINSLLGGYFGSRLMKNIREDKGYTYGIYSMVHSLQEALVFFVTAEVGSQYSQPAINEIYAELEKLTQNPVEKEELALVKNYLTGEFLRSIDGIFELSEKYKGLLETNIPTSYYASYIKAIEDSTPEKLLQIAQQYLQPNSMVEVCAGKK